MSSIRRIQASQRNGARSKGPKTAAGKVRSSENATRHGLLAKRVVLSNESEENFQIVMDQYVEKLDPQDGVEYSFVEEMVACYWRLHRSMAIEKGLFDQALQKHPNGLQINRAAEAWSELAAGDALKLLLRYQTALHRNFQRSMNNLLLLRDIEPENIEPRNEPSPTSGHSEVAPPPPESAAAEPPVTPAPAGSPPHPAPRPPKSAPLPIDPLARGVHRPKRST